LARRTREFSVKLALVLKFNIVFIRAFKLSNIFSRVLKPNSTFIRGLKLKSMFNRVSSHLFIRRFNLNIVFIRARKLTNMSSHAFKLCKQIWCH
jgi:hypothetical protein